MLKLKPFRQKTGFCGPASIKMVLGYFGIKKKEAEIATETEATMERGVEAERLVEYVKSLGLKAVIRDGASLEDIRYWVREKQIPVIVDWFSEDDGHYSVVVDIDDENIYLIDPEIGYHRAMRLGRFYRVWFDFPGDFINTPDELVIRRMVVIHPDEQDG